MTLNTLMSMVFFFNVYHESITRYLIKVYDIVKGTLGSLTHGPFTYSRYHDYVLFGSLALFLHL